MSREIASYRAFWPFYLRQHSRPLTRVFHYIGTGTAIGCLVLGLIGNSALLIAVPFAGYGFAWAGHVGVEHNKPATFTYPWWSLISDLRMFALFVTGRLRPHLVRAGVSN